MCFIVNNNSKELIAIDDIICYKLLWAESSNENLRSSDYFYKYELGKMNIPIKLSFDYHYPSRYYPLGNTISQGYHSFSNQNSELTACLLGNPHPTTRKKDERVPVSCIIPRGSTYYLNSSEGLYISSNIVITELFDKSYRNKK